MLFEHGQTQEVGVLLRIVNEFQQDVTFLIEKQKVGARELQRRFVQDIIKEIYGNQERPLEGTIDHAPPPRLKVVASSARRFSSDAKVLADLDADVYSAFDHAAYPTVLEIYGHDKAEPRYHPFGVLTSSISFMWAQPILAYREGQIHYQVAVAQDISNTENLRRWSRCLGEICARLGSIRILDRSSEQESYC